MLDLTDSHVHAPRLLSDGYLQRAETRLPPIPTLGIPAGSGERLFGHALTAIEIVGVGGAMSYLNAKHAAPGKNAYEVLGLPADVVLGLAFSGTAVFTNYFGRYAEHGLNVGLGLLLAYACRMGSIWGDAARREAPPAGVRGYFQSSGERPFQPAPAPAEAAVPQYPWAA
ncbi:MAG TPA: hypothetical protein VMN82_05015 [Thermoanaerobaculia bacterium]|nr:hypothetical protein [Thermoanaerobaculia bacterium]